MFAAAYSSKGILAVDYGIRHGQDMLQSRYTDLTYIPVLPPKATSDLNNELASAGVLLLCQVLSAGLEVIKHILLVAMSTTIMPFQAILPPTSAQLQTLSYVSHWHESNTCLRGLSAAAACFPTENQVLVIAK